MRPMKVSVVITCYNYGRYLSGAIDSVLRQTYSNFEIIIIDDGSTDNTEEIARSYSSCSRVTYIRQNNAGQANAKNTGIQHASGDFIAFLDADDLWCEQKLEKQMVCFNDSRVGVVYCKARYMSERSEEIFVDQKEKYLQPKRGKVTEWLFLDNFVPFSSSVVRAQCFEKFGLFDESLKMGIDWDLWLRISTLYYFDYIEDPLFFYRIGHGDQMSKNLEVRQGCSDFIMNRFISNYPGELSKEIIDKANYYTYCNRGEYFRNVNLMKSFKYFFMALNIFPFAIRAYKGSVKNLINIFRK